MANYKVLFVGNSYTFYNDMPSIFARLASSLGYETEICSITKGGEKLLGHADKDSATYPRLKEALEGGHFDFAILQEQSLRPVLSPALFCEGGEKMATILSGKVDSIVLYATWARRHDSEFYTDHPMTVADMTSALDSAYSSLASRIGARTAHVGRAFERLGADELYDADASHPSYLGSCLAALVLVKTAFCIDDYEVRLLSSVCGLSELDSKRIKCAVFY